MDFGDDQDYYAPSSSGATGRPMRYKEPLSIEETTADEQRLVNRALRPGGVTDGMSEAEKLSFAKSLVAKNRREVRERERRKEAAMRMESDSFGYELQALENFRVEKEAREEREKQLAKERRADRAAQRHEEVQARLAALRGGAPPLIRPKGSLPTRMVSRGGTEYELKPIQSSLSSSSSTSAEANEYETLQSEMNNGVSDYHHQHTSSNISKWASSSSSSSSIKSSSSHAQIEAAIAGNRKLTSMTQEKVRGTASFVSKIGKPTAFAPVPTPAPAPGLTLTLEGKNAEPMMVDRQYVLARPLQLHPWQQPASMRVLKERQREVVEQQERLKEIQKQTQILLEQEQALKARVEAQKREKAKQEKNALMRKAHVPLAPPSGAAVSPRVMNDHDVLYPSNTHSVYRSYEDEDVRSPKPGSLYNSPHVSAFKERVGQSDIQDQHQQEYVEEEEEVGDDEDAVAEIVAAEAAILAQKERLLAALGGSPISSSLQSASGFTTFDTNQSVNPGMKVESSSIDRQQVQHSTNHPRGIPQSSRLLQPSLQVSLQGQLSQVPSKSSPFKEANVTSSVDTKQSICFPTQSGIQVSSPSKGTDPLSPGQRKRQERQRQREIEEARDAAEEAAERAVQIAKEASAAVTAAKQAEEAAKVAERALMMKMKMLEVEGPQTATIGPIQKKPQKAEKKVSKSKRMNEKLHSDDIDEDDGEGVFIPGLELIGVPLRAETNSIKSSNLPKGVSTRVTEHSNSNALPLQNLVDGDEETFAENDEEVGEGEGMMEGHNTIAAESDDDAYFAASKIQALVRGRAARQSVNLMRNLDNHIARTHHESVSSNLNEDTNEEEALALEEATAVEAMYAAKHEAAAIKLQALQRGRAVRSERRMMINNGDDLIEVVKIDVISVNQDLTLEEKVQLEYAESVSNVYETRHEVAAIRLQALQRGRAVRSKFNFTKTHGAYSTENDVHSANAQEAMKTEGEDIEEAALTNQALEVKQKMYEAEHHAAAVKVQALARGRAVRKQARTYHNSSDQSLVNELFDAKELAEAYKADHQAAATRLQAFQRGRAVRNRMRTSTSNQIEAPLLAENVAEIELATDSNPSAKVYAAEHNEAAIKLQALQRGRAVRKELNTGRRQLSFMSTSQIEANFSLDGDGEKQDLVEPSVLEEIRSDETVIEREPEVEEGRQAGEGQVDPGLSDQRLNDQGHADELLLNNNENFDVYLVNNGHDEERKPTVVETDADDTAENVEVGAPLMSNDSLM